MDSLARNLGILDTDRLFPLLRFHREQERRRKYFESLGGLARSIESPLLAFIGGSRTNWYPSDYTRPSVTRPAPPAIPAQPIEAEQPQQRRGRPRKFATADEFRANLFKEIRSLGPDARQIDVESILFGVTGAYGARLRRELRAWGMAGRRVSGQHWSAIVRAAMSVSDDAE